MCVVGLWDVCGRVMGCVWSGYGMCVVGLWDVCGRVMGCLS
jgi:hypothetical protein